MRSAFLLCLLAIFMIVGQPAIAADSLPEAPSLRVSLTLQNAEPTTVFDLIQEQTGVTLTAVPSTLWQQKSWPHVSLKLDNVPLMEALAAACQAIGVYMEFGPQNTLLILDHDHPAAVPPSEFYRSRAVKGPLMLIGSAIELRDGPHVVVTLYIKPGKRLYSVARLPFLTHVEDDQGRILKPLPLRADDPFGLVGYIPSAWGYGLSVGLQVPAGQPIRHLKRIEGSQQVTLVNASKRVEVTQVDQRRNVLVSLPEHDLRINHLSADPINPDGYLVHGRLIRRPGDTDMAWKKAIRSFSAIIVGLSDAQGRPLNYRGTSLGGHPTYADLTFRFNRRDTDRNSPFHPDAWRAAWPEPPLPGNPVMLWFDAPTQTTTVDVPFVFENIPIRQPLGPQNQP